MWRITVEVLEELGETGILMWGENLTYLQIYGPSGKLGSYVSATWPDSFHGSKILHRYGDL
jgi:hypothetical protein